MPRKYSFVGNCPYSKWTITFWILPNNKQDCHFPSSPRFGFEVLWLLTYCKGGQEMTSSAVPQCHVTVTLCDTFVCHLMPSLVRHFSSCYIHFKWGVCFLIVEFWGLCILYWCISLALAFCKHFLLLISFPCSRAYALWVWGQAGYRSSFRLVGLTT